MLDFIQANWSYLATAVLVVLEVILFILKKRPQVVDNSFISLICQWILEAEVKFKVGSDKMCYVLDQAKLYLKDNYRETEIKNIVEYLLTLPEKKR